MSGNMNLGITSSSVLTTYPQTMTCIVDGTNIIQVDFYGNRQKVGVTQSAYDYYNKLVELKVITPPKTSEEIQQEQTQLMADMLKEMQNMKREIEVLKNDQSTSCSTNAETKPAGHEPPCGSMGDGDECSEQG